MTKIPGEVTLLPGRLRDGDASARDALFALTCGRLRDIAAGLLHSERYGHTLQPTALVNETLLHFLGGAGLQNATDREHFFAILTAAMRNVLIDYERARRSDKRGGAMARHPLEAAFAAEDTHDSLRQVELLDTIEALAAVHERAAEVVTLRFVVGYSVPEVAALLGQAERTVERDWRFAKAWLRRRLGGGRHSAEDESHERA